MGCVAIGALFSLAVFLQPMSVATGWLSSGSPVALLICNSNAMSLGRLYVKSS